MSIFSWDSPLAQTISKLTDYVIVNILCLIFCIPVITIGAALTARYDVGMKLYRGEEPAAAKAFLKSFKSNFKPATISWLIEIAVFIFFVFDWNMAVQMQKSTTTFVFQLLLGVVSVYLFATFLCVYAFIARFEMTMKEYFKAASVLTYIKFPRMLLAIILFAAPFILSYFYMKWLPLVLVVIPYLELYFNGGMFAKAFKKIEPESVDEEIIETKNIPK